jgi:hypothetical protein
VIGGDDVAESYRESREDFARLSGNNHVTTRDLGPNTNDLTNDLSSDPNGSSGNGAAAKGKALSRVRKAFVRVTGADLPAVLQAVWEDAEAITRKAELREYWAAVVFAYWAKVHNHPAARIDDKRLNLLVKRLTEWEDDPSPLLYAVKGSTKDDWITGRSPRSSEKHDRLEFLFRDFAQTEYLAEKGGYKPQAVHPLAHKYGPPTLPH